MKIKPWVSDAVEVKQSGMEGKGVYALRDIKENEVVGVFGGIVVPEDEIETLTRTVAADKLNIDHAMYASIPVLSCFTITRMVAIPLCFVNHALRPKRQGCEWDCSYLHQGHSAGWGRDQLGLSPYR